MIEGIEWMEDEEVCDRCRAVRARGTCIYCKAEIECSAEWPFLPLMPLSTKDLAWWLTEDTNAAI